MVKEFRLEEGRWEDTGGEEMQAAIREQERREQSEKERRVSKKQTMTNG